ncbi:MAG TPA: arsinothricin resistance N-acetyltransferase ArsN1 family A [Candidatus Limnocylindrales bacterium]
MTSSRPTSPAELRTRPATAADVSAIRRIYNEGIEDRIATFETEPRADADVAAWLEAGRPLMVVEAGGRVVGWAGAFPYRPHRAAYRGIAEYSVYVARDARRLGAGRAVLQALIDEADARGYWKLVSRIFPENVASIGLATELGFRVVGRYERHGRLDGEWRDCVIVERLMGEATR